MGKKKEALDYEALKKKTLEQVRSGKGLFSKGGKPSNRLATLIFNSNLHPSQSSPVYTFFNQP